MTTTVIEPVPSPPAEPDGDAIGERCDASGCAGARLQGAHCIEHITEDELHQAGDRLRRPGETLDARDASISSERMNAVLQALAVDETQPCRPAADPRGPTFNGPARFEGATFLGPVSFEGARFEDIAFFDRASFRDRADFSGATFCRHADLDRVTFSGPVDFSWSTFDDHAGFQLSTWRGAASFEGAKFRSYADFEDATFHRGLCFARATFQLAHQLGPLVVGQQIVFDHCVFATRIAIEVAAAIVSARGATFSDGVHLRVRWAEIALDNADFARPSTLSAAAAWQHREDLGPACIVDERRVELEGPCPRLVTLRGAQVAHLSLSGIDLRPCRFFGAHGLQSLSIEAGCRWPRTPAGVGHIDRATIAEEHCWRGAGWRDPGVLAPRWLHERDSVPPLETRQLAALYRALRKAREDDKDQAGAGDLYYGEMQMRRSAPMPKRGHRGRARVQSERAVLFAYWLLSGYGLRACRALLALLVAVIIASAGLHEWGFRPAVPVTRAVMYSVESTSALIRSPHAPGHDIRYAGEVIQIVLRIIGPLLIGLALLAFRSPVKR